MSEKIEVLIDEESLNKRIQEVADVINIRIMRVRPCTLSVY